jgi:hypothetical protein
MSGVVNIFRNKVVPVVSAATGIGVAFSQIFVKVYEVNGAPGTLMLGLSNVVGVFSGLQINIEWSPTNGSGTYFEVVGTWAPLTAGVGICQISEAGYYRLNVTTFTGGTSFDVLATVGLPAGSIVQSGTAADVTLVGSSITLPVSIAAPIAVTGTFWQAIQPVSGTVAVSNFPATPFTFTNYGSPPVEAANVYVVNPVTFPGTVNVAGAVSVSNFPASQAVTGTFWPTTQPVSIATVAVTNAGTFPVQAQDVSAGNASTSQVSITSTATAIVAARATRNSVKITNMGTTPIYLGFTSGVTVSTGDFLPGILGAFVVYPTQTGVWGIVATGSSPPSEVVAVADVWN